MRARGVVVELVVELSHGPVAALADGLAEGGREAVGKVDVELGVEILRLRGLVGVGCRVDQYARSPRAGFGDAAGEAGLYQAEQLAVSAVACILSISPSSMAFVLM